MLVGAPRDNVTDSDAPEVVRQLVRPGAIYGCPFTAAVDDCRAVKVDREGQFNVYYVYAAVLIPSTRFCLCHRPAHKSQDKHPYLYLYPLNVNAIFPHTFLGVSALCDRRRYFLWTRNQSTEYLENRLT